MPDPKWCNRKWCNRLSQGDFDPAIPVIYVLAAYLELTSTATVADSFDTPIIVRECSVSGRRSRRNHTGLLEDRFGSLHLTGVARADHPDGTWVVDDLLGNRLRFLWITPGVKRRVALDGPPQRQGVLTICGAPIVGDRGPRLTSTLNRPFSFCLNSCRGPELSPRARGHQ
jgi:hypothetical protein